MVYWPSQLTRECMEFFMIAARGGPAIGSRNPVSLGQPVHSSYRQLVCARIFITAARQRSDIRAFWPGRSFLRGFIGIDTQPRDENNPSADIAPLHTHTHPGANRISFQIEGFCLNYTCIHFNHKSAGTRAFFSPPSFIYSYKRASYRFTALPSGADCPRRIFRRRRRRYLAIGLTQIGRRINKAHTQRRESDRHSQRYDLWRHRK